MDGIKLYTTLERAYDDACREIKAAGEKESIYLSIWCGYGDKPYLQIESKGRYGKDKVEVKGKNLDDMVEEYIRRCGFTNTQETLQIGARTIEATEVEVGESTLTADEIPF